MKKRKQDLLLIIKNLDQRADRIGLVDTEWRRRYSLENELVEIYNKEEVMWQTRGGEKWLLEGDANTAYFHGIANGRKRKCQINSLEDDGDIISGTEALQLHITNFYKKLFGSEPQPKISLDADLWDEYSKVSEEDNNYLTKPFTLAELEVVVQGMRDGSAPRPDGFNSIFFKMF
jgi:mannosylglycoprotein endo-beta-mannosidase